jgi:hypothetical protein
MPWQVSDVCHEPTVMVLARSVTACTLFMLSITKPVVAAAFFKG